MKIISLSAAVLILTVGRFITSDFISSFLTGLGIMCGFIAGYLDAKDEE